MCDNDEDVVKSRHSLGLARSPRIFIRSDTWKSDTDIIIPTLSDLRHKKSSTQTKNGCGEYYKRYEHDEIPVKDDSCSNDTQALSDAGTGDGCKLSLTSSHLQKIELNAFKNLSQELQSDEDSTSSLESHIKFFKTTVQEILKNFNTSMRDFELYKKRFHDILNKNRHESLEEMESLIKDMIQNIMSSESVSNASHKLTDQLSYNISNVSDRGSMETSCTSENKCAGNLESIIENYKNVNYLTDSTFDRTSSNDKTYTKKDEIFNIYLLARTPCVEINLNERNLLSESNIKDVFNEDVCQFASAENLKKLAAKKLQLEKYISQQQNNFDSERDIPVKESCAKKNIYLDEDFSSENDRNENKSLISKICNFLCKKFRKNSLS